jgi:hypothetical protein
MYSFFARVGHPDIRWSIIIIIIIGPHVVADFYACMVQ